MCASLHQGPRAARVQSDVVTAYVTFTGRVREGRVLGSMNRSSSVGYWSEDWISVSSVHVFCLDYQLLVCNWAERRRSTGLHYVVQLDTADTTCQLTYTVDMLTNSHLFTSTRRGRNTTFGLLSISSWGKYLVFRCLSFHYDHLTC